MVKQISDNEIYLLIKYIKSVLWRVAKYLSYIEEVLCLKVKRIYYLLSERQSFHSFILVLFDVNFKRAFVFNKNDFHCRFSMSLWTEWKYSL